MKNLKIKKNQKKNMKPISETRGMLNAFLFLIFVVTSILLFIFLNRVHPYYFIDEVFHIPQTLRYCNGEFGSVSIFCFLTLI